MGKGDKKTKRGKLFSGSYGVTRPRKKKKTYVVSVRSAEAQPKNEKIDKVVEAMPVEKKQGIEKQVPVEVIKEKSTVAPKKAAKVEKLEETGGKPVAKAKKKPVKKKEEAAEARKEPKTLSKKTAKAKEPSKTEAKTPTKPVKKETKPKTTAKPKLDKTAKVKDATPKATDKGTKKE